jgi:hypothetical protein
MYPLGNGWSNLTLSIQDLNYYSLLPLLESYFMYMCTQTVYGRRNAKWYILYNGTGIYPWAKVEATVSCLEAGSKLSWPCSGVIFILQKSLTSLYVSLFSLVWTDPTKISLCEQTLRKSLVWTDPTKISLCEQTLRKSLVWTDPTKISLWIPRVNMW